MSCAGRYRRALRAPLARRLHLSMRLLRVVPRALPTLLPTHRGIMPLARGAWERLRAAGWRGVRDRIAFVAGLVHRGPDPLDIEQIKRRIAAMPEPPLISIVMPTHNTREAWLRRAIDSVVDQLYPHWQLCICDDASSAPHVREVLREYAQREPRICVHFRTDHGGVCAASNAAVAMATGDFAALLDHDDELRLDALFHIAREIKAHPGVQLIYTDEDKISIQGLRCDPHFKPDWNYDLFLSYNLITHLAVYRLQRLKEIGGFRCGFEGAQDYDLALRFITGLPAACIRHVPHLLYHWRMHPDSTALSQHAKPHAHEAARRAIKDHLRQLAIDAEVLPAPEEATLHRVKYALPLRRPRVTLIILTRDRLALLKRCVESVLSKTDYPSFETMIIDNGSTCPATLGYLAELSERENVTVRRREIPFNFSRLNNEAVRSATGDIIGLLNNDTEVLNADWLREMVSQVARPGIGVVGARLWYPHFQLQHGGIIVGVGGVAGHAHKHLPRGLSGYMHRAVVVQNLSAVTAACMLVRRHVYEEVGGFDERLAVAFNDVDFCLKVCNLGYRVLWTPYAELLHHESASRGYEDTREKHKRFAHEIALVKSRWGELLLRDPAYNPNLTLDSEDFSLATQPRVALLAEP
jgi:GT2 family glycosyltransferase